MTSLLANTPAAFTETRSPRRGEGYSVVKTPVLLDELEKEGFQTVWAKQKMSRNQDDRLHAKHMIRLRRRGQDAVMDGEVYPELVLVNAHDGSSSLRLITGLFRIVCENGLIVADENFGEVSIRHSRKSAMEDAIAAAHCVADQSLLVTLFATSMKSIEISEHDQLDFAAAAAEIRHSEKSVIGKSFDPRNLLIARRLEDERSDAWSVLNRVQENIMIGGFSVDVQGSGRTRRIGAINGVTQTIDMNLALWNLARKMWKI